MVSAKSVTASPNISRVGNCPPSAGVWPPWYMVISDQDRTCSHWSGAYPSRRPIMIAGSRDAIASTASHEPRGATASTIAVATARTSSSWVETARGVNRRTMSDR